MKTIATNLKRASVEMVLLSLLAKEDKYGYQMTQEIKKQTEGQFTLLEGSMYPILYRLCENGDVEFREVKVGVRMTRIYYHITESGLERLKQMRETFRQQLEMINKLTNYTEDSAHE